jgi:hypothetical protein
MYHITYFYCDSMVAYLKVVYKYDGILIILIDDIFIININFVVKYQYDVQCLRHGHRINNLNIFSLSKLSYTHTIFLIKAVCKNIKK